ncbi:MAG: hypothetical protein VKK42_04145 [Lyngbya sp.]|nr:hypothetical protein [Lyngbya sp.]
MFSLSSPRNHPDQPPSLPDDEIPDPYDWIQEHHSLACVAGTLSVLNETPNDSIPESEDLSYTAEGELVIDRKTRNLLKANCGDRHWRYVRKYF